MSRSRLHGSRSGRINRACIETLEGRRLLSFSPAVNHSTIGTPSFIATADFNGDGKLDLATCAHAATGSVSVLLGDGSGGFAAAQRTVVGQSLGSMAVDDFDSDGKADIVAADLAYSLLHYLKGNGDGTFQPPVSKSVMYYLGSVALAHFGNDSHADLLVTQWEWEGVSTIYQAQFGDGNGGFSEPVPISYTWDTTYESLGIVLATTHLDSDGKLDVITGPAVKTGDFTGDGVADVINVGYNGLLAVLPGKADGTFHAPILHTANGLNHAAVATTDFNADGKLDAIVTDYDLGTVSVMLGNGDGSLRFFGAFATGTSPSGVVVGDFNRDGRPDAAVSNAGADSRTVSILLNDGNWQTPQPPPPAPPEVSINDVTVTEGHTGTKSATFTLTLSKPATVQASVSFLAAGITAVPGSDFDYTSGIVIFAAGETSKTVTVAVRGDQAKESNETFAVNLVSSSNLRIADAQGIGTIVNDDVEWPRISINNVIKSEGHSKTTTFSFTVKLSAASEQAVTVKYATKNGTAKSGSDYTSRGGTLTFAPGETSKTITIAVNGDRTKESSETFFVDLFGASSNSLISVGRGTGTIVDDDNRWRSLLEWLRGARCC